MTDVIQAVAPPVTDKLTILHLGCGRYKRTPKDLGLTITLDVPIEMINLDGNPDVKPDLVCWLGRDRIDLPDDSVDLVIAMHVLEHIGQQGQTGEWFQFWEEIYRVLKPNGQLMFECPLYSSTWAWADPTHVRAISLHTFLYFNQDAYRSGGAIPDYRIRCDFQNGGIDYRRDTQNKEVSDREDVSFIYGTLVARKPLRPWWED